MKYKTIISSALFLLMANPQLSIAKDVHNFEMPAGFSCSQYPDLNLTMTPEDYQISWTTGSSEYDPVYRLVPIIMLFGEAGGSGFANKDAVVYLQFWPSRTATNAAWTGYTNNEFYFDYPIEHFEPLLDIIQARESFRVIFKTQEERCFGTILVDKQSI